MCTFFFDDSEAKSETQDVLLPPVPSISPYLYWLHGAVLVKIQDIFVNQLFTSILSIFAAFSLQAKPLALLV